MISKARKIIDQLVADNLYYAVLSSLRERTTAGHLRVAGKPGDAILRLSPNEREELSKLTSDEIANVRSPY